MKRIMVLLIGVMLLITIAVSQNNRERRLYLNEYVAPEELVSMSKTLPFDKAISLFSEFSKKYVNKIIVDATNSKNPIGVDIENMYWLQAFESVLRQNNLWYDEREEFFYVYAPVDSSRYVSKGGVLTRAAIDSAGRVLLRQRDVRISSVFFTVDVVKSAEEGINWNYFYSGDASKGTPTQFGAELGSAIPDSLGTNAGFLAKVVPAIKFSNVSALISFFQSNQLGNVLSGPSIVVSSGKQGRIQVGQDFFITTRDFSGNTILTPQSTGIIIQVTPTVYDEKGIKFINLDISAERSTVSGVGSTPIINKSSAKTFSVVYDGEETVIGGLYTTDESATRGGIPFLKDLPWWFFGLRYVFGFDRTSTTTQELIILLKAEVIPTIEERVANAAEQKNVNLIEQQQKKNASEIERLKPKK